MLGNVNLFFYCTYSIEAEDSQSYTNTRNLTSLFKSNSVDNLELDINTFCSKHQLSYKKEQCPDRIISILSIFNNEAISKDKDMLHELITIILTDLITTDFKLADSKLDNQKFLNIFKITIDLLLGNKIAKNCIHLYYHFYELMFNAFIQQGTKTEDDRMNQYSIFFEFMIQNSSWQKIANAVTDFIIKNHHLKEGNENVEISQEDEERFSEIITFADQIIYPHLQYYKMLKNNKDIFFIKDKGITNLGILLLTAINRANLINYSTYRFFESTINQAIDKENPDLKTNNYNTKTFTSYLHILLCIRAILMQPNY